MKTIDGAIHEGRAAYVLGSRMDANPYQNASPALTPSNHKHKGRES